MDTRRGRSPRASRRRSATPETSVEREEIFWATRRLFEALARERPLVVFFEDVHWAEPTFLDLVEYLAERMRGAPILLVCIARPELLDAATGLGPREGRTRALSCSSAFRTRTARR